MSTDYLQRIKSLTPANYLEALNGIELTQKQMNILQIHLAAPSHLLTQRQLSQALGFTKWNAANLVYGKLAGMFCEALGLAPSTKLSVLVEFFKTTGSDYELRLRPPFAEALREFGLSALISTDELFGMKVHVLVGNAAEDPNSLRMASLSETVIEWVVPKNAAAGDKVLVFIKGLGFVATGSISGSPYPYEGSYRANLRNVNLLNPPLSSETVSSKIPSWKWLTYPRSYTTPSPEIASDLLATIDWWLQEPIPDLDMSSAFEGGRRLRVHLRLERDRAIIERKKLSALQETGGLCCEACGFDFARAYGVRGDKFCEVHHILPLSERNKPAETKLRDLAIVCSNCHRMLHRGDLISLTELKQIIKSNDCSSCHDY